MKDINPPSALPDGFDLELYSDFINDHLYDFLDDECELYDDDDSVISRDCPFKV